MLGYRSPIRCIDPIVISFSFFLPFFLLFLHHHSDHPLALLLIAFLKGNLSSTHSPLTSDFPSRHGAYRGAESGWEWYATAQVNEERRPTTGRRCDQEVESGTRASHRSGPHLCAGQEGKLLRWYISLAQLTRKPEKQVDPDKVVKAEKTLFNEVKQSGRAGSKKGYAQEITFRPDGRQRDVYVKGTK